MITVHYRTTKNPEYKNNCSFRVPIFLYPTLNDKARSLSTLIAVVVNKDKPQRRYPAMILVENVLKHSFHRFLIAEIQ